MKYTNRKSDSQGSYLIFEDKRMLVLFDIGIKLAYYSQTTFFTQRNTFPMPNPSNPMIVQSDRTVLLEVENPLYEDARDELNGFAELLKSPEHIHTYRISPLSLWNAAAAGMTAVHIINALEHFSKYDVPENIKFDIIETIARYGKVQLQKHDDKLILTSEDPLIITEITKNRTASPLISSQLDENTLTVPLLNRGHLKQVLIKIGYPVEDLAGYTAGDYLEIDLRSETARGLPFSLREYQFQAVDVFHDHGSSRGGSGVVVLPCGAGKTVVGLAALEKLKTRTLILATNVIAVRQWIDEIVDKTSLNPGDVGEYTGESKEIRPITVTTYQILTYRKRKSKEFPHLALFNQENWGFIIYDEVHLLPAPVFRITAEIQAKRRLGLTATLVREDGREDDVFSLIGPKKYDVPWKVLEKQGWIATALCTEVRIDMPHELRMSYAVGGDREKFRIASENPLKTDVARALLKKHFDDSVLIIGQYIDQLQNIASEFNAPIITGATPNRDRRTLYDRFRNGEINLLVVSKVANFAIDLPDANVAIQVSGTFGSRQEEAQRLGRILRPKDKQAHFYSLVSRGTKDADFALNRQLFLTEQGYKYVIADASEVINHSN